MTRNNGGAMVLANVIKDMLNFGTGPMNIPLDDIRVELRKTPVRGPNGWHNLTLDEARDFIDRHLSTALDILGDDGWSSVKTTQHWEDIGYAEPTTEAAIKRCIAGIGRASLAVGLHFVMGEDDWLWVYARAHGGSTWRGKRHAESERLQIASDNKELTETGLKIAERSAVHPIIGDKKDRQVRKNLTPEPPSSKQIPA